MESSSRGVNINTVNQCPMFGGIWFIEGWTVGKFGEAARWVICKD